MTESANDLSIDAASAIFGEMLDPKEDAVDPVDTEIDTTKEPEPNEQAEGDDAPISVEIDGKQVELTKAQIAEAYRHSQDAEEVAKKSKIADNARSLADAETRKAQQERHTYAQNLVKMAAQLEGAIQQQDKIDWDQLLKDNPVAFLEQKHLYDQRQALYQQNLREQEDVSRKIQAEQTENLKSHLATQQQELLAKLPEWKDEGKAKAEREALKRYLIKQGYDDASINGITDHRAVILGRKAMLYDQMMDKAKAAAKKVQNLPTKIERPGVTTESGRLDGRQQAMRSLMKTGSVEDAAKVFSSLLG